MMRLLLGPLFSQKNHQLSLAIQTHCTDTSPAWCDPLIAPLPVPVPVPAMQCTMTVICKEPHSVMCQCTVPGSALHTGGEQLCPVRRRPLSQLEGASCFLASHCTVVLAQDTRQIYSSLVTYSKLVNNKILWTLKMLEKTTVVPTRDWTAEWRAGR